MKEEALFLEYLKEHGFKKTKQRKLILEKFLEMKGHVCADELYRAAKKIMPGVGQSTVFRAVKLLKQAQIASEVNFTGLRRRFEPGVTKHHHDHLICEECGKALEVYDDRIEKLQDLLAKRHSFAPSRHRMEIFGLCKDCKK
ncbi:transcriptional repressor [Candidatus Saganbacteria bacterium]|nr:transcriptional repressor [Candidatus Saganbacteria bacterium]